MKAGSNTTDLDTPREVIFDKETGSLLIQLVKETFDLEGNTVYLEGIPLEPKDELHITILSRDAADTLSQHLEKNPEDEDRVRRLIDETRWEYRKLDRFYHVREEPGVETIIQMVEIPGLASFFNQLSQIVKVELGRPPTHVTLYMRGTQKGIGLPTQAEFERLAQKQIHPAVLESERKN